MNLTPGLANQSVQFAAWTTATGAPVTVTSATAGLSLWYRRDGGAKVAISPVDLSLLTSAHSDGGILLIGGAEHRLDLPDAACSDGVAHVQWGGEAAGITISGGVADLETGGTLTQEEVAEAMNLGTSGQAEDGSVIDRLTEVQAQTDRIGSIPVQLTPPSIRSGRPLSLSVSSDYTVTGGNPLSWTITGAPDMTDATVLFSVLDFTTLAEVFHAHGTVTLAGSGDQTVQVELRDEATSALTYRKSYWYRLVITYPELTSGQSDPNRTVVENTVIVTP